jgi:hypothetical protein
VTRITTADARWLAAHMHDPELADILYRAVIRTAGRGDLRLVPCRVWSDAHRGTVPSFAIVSDRS